MKEANITFYQTIGNIAFRFEILYLEDVNPSNYNKVGKLQFGGMEITLFYIDKRVTVHPEDLVSDTAYMTFEESPLEWTHKHLDREVSTWMKECLIKFDRSIECLS